MVSIQPILLKGQVHDGLAMLELFVREFVEILGRIDLELLLQYHQALRDRDSTQVLLNNAGNKPKKICSENGLARSS